ncbi:MAG: ester cyclase [Verrucomicrobiota bacterium]
MQRARRKTALLSLLISLLGFTCHSQAMTEKESKELMNRFWNEVWNPPYRLETIDELLTEDFTITTDNRDVKGREAFKKWLQGFQAKVADLKVVPQEIIVSGDGSRIITRMTASGKNKGMFGTLPDNASVEFVAIAIFEVRDGKLAHNWVERSAYELHQRLTAKTKP